MPGCSANFTYIPIITTAHTPMLLARLAINPEDLGSKPAVDIFSFVTNFF